MFAKCLPQSTIPAIPSCHCVLQTGMNVCMNELAAKPFSPNWQQFCSCFAFFPALSLALDTRTRANISNGNQIALNCWKKAPFKKRSPAARQLASCTGC